MTRDSIPTLLSLSRFAEILGLNPWYFSQATTATYDGDTSCDPLFLQFAWMDADKLSREDIARAIDQAEQDIANRLGWWPAPKWITDEDHRYPPHHDKALFGVYGINQRGQGKSVTSKWAKVRAVGQQAKTLISAGVAVNITGENVTVSVATTVTETSEIEVYFRVADGADEAASDTYRIRPLKVTITAGAATITGKKWLFLDPTLWDAPDSIDGDDASNYVTLVDVYRVYNDPSDPADFYWETLPEGCTDTDNSGCQFITQTACLLIRNADNGFLVPSPAEWDADTSSFTEQSFSQNWEPDKVRINYRAGYPLGADGEMDDYWARAVAYYSCALLGRESCDCGNASKFMLRWQEDLALNAESGKNYQLSAEVLNCPFGTERGAVFAWQRVKREAIGGGTAI